MNGIVFLDRDGTLIRDTGYLRDPDLVEPLAGAVEGCRLLADHGYLLAVVSNQAGIARGKITPDEQEAVHARFVERFLSNGIRFDAVEYCPHHPEGVVAGYALPCACRKPETGMGDRVLERLSVPASWSRYMVGDKMIDIQMGKRLGARTILVATGYGSTDRIECVRRGVPPDAFLPDILEAARWILKGTGAR